MAFFGLHTASLVLLIVALAFLIIGTISQPVTGLISLASTSSYTYGIFGYCASATAKCSKALYPYGVGDIDTKVSWLLANSTRNTLAKIFIICPIAAGVTLFALIAVVVAHAVGSMGIIVGLILTILSLVLTAITAIVVVVTFHPNVSWAGWLLVGAAAAQLIAIPLLGLGLRLVRNANDDDDDDEKLTAVEDLTRFDNTFEQKFNHVQPGFSAPSYNSNKLDDNSSISKDFEYKIKPTPAGYAPKNTSNSSIYNSNPQLASDFTQHQRSQALLAQNSSNKLYYEDAKMVNGPNTPVSQHIAPNFVANRATPASNDAPAGNVPRLPYPQSNANSPLNRPAYNPTNLGVFEHHPEVEGHKPFTELPDDEDDPTTVHHNPNASVDLDSDNDSDFTSVSQRAPNPQYYPQGQQGYFPQQYPNTAQYSPQNPQYQNQFQFQPQQQQQPPRQQFNGPPLSFSSGPNNYYSGSQAPAAPTVSDSILSNNPDFAFAGASRRKQFGGPGRPQAASNFVPPAQRNRQNGPYSFR